MNTFGVTLQGLSSYIKDAQRSEFVEPLQLPITSNLLNLDAPLPEKVPVHDVYHPNVDGHAYSSYDLLSFVRRKGIPKPTGPKDEFRLPATTSMDYGWFDNDPDLCGKWFLVSDPAPRVSSDATRFYTSLKQVERYILKL